MTFWIRNGGERCANQLLVADHVRYRRFKAYNDAKGHTAGDECLKRVSAAISSAGIAPAIWLPVMAEMSLSQYCPVQASTRSTGGGEPSRRVESLGMKHADSELVTISVGYACIVPNRNASPTDLIKAADQALYQAKQEGRNRIKSASILSLVQDSHDD